MNTSAINQATRSLAVPLNDDNLYRPTAGVYVGGAGDLKVRLAGDSADVTFSNLGDGQVLPVRAVKLYKTGSTVNDVAILANDQRPTQGVPNGHLDFSSGDNAAYFSLVGGYV